MYAHIRTAAIGLAAVITASILAPAIAWAHPGAPRLQPVFERIVPSHEGVDVQIVPTRAAPRFTIRVSGEQELTVLGAHGEPFLRIGPRGAWVNTASGSAGMLDDPFPAPSEAGSEGSPSWQQVTRTPEITFYEPRAQVPDDMDLGAVIERGEPATVHQWSIPAVYAGGDVELTGRVDWLPGGGFHPEAFLPVAIVGLAAAWWVALDRRRLMRTAAVGAAAAVLAEGYLAVSAARSTGGPGVVALAPLAGLVLVAWAIPLAWRGRRSGHAALLVFGGYLSVFGVIRLLAWAPGATWVQLVALVAGGCLVLGAGALLRSPSEPTQPVPRLPEPQHT